MLKRDVIRNYLKQPVDNTSLIIFRMAFGFLIAVESFGAIMTGWVKRVFMEPEFTFTFIGFEWLQPLPGPGMYFYYGLMGIAGLAVMAGFYYRYSMGLFTLLWWGTYLMQKTSYNNHYYLLVLLCFLMLLVPAHRNASLDVRQQRVAPAMTCPRWCREIFKWQLLIVFTYAALAKFYPGWLQGDFISYSFSAKSGYPLIGDLLQKEWLQQLVVYGGIAYDLFIIPVMYGPRTRKTGLVVSVVFHLFNSVVFGIGIFPYLMLASMVLFFPVASWRTKIPGYRVLSKEQNEANISKSPRRRESWLLAALAIYFLWQLWLPVRHYFIPGDVFKTEEGHRMAWRMMLRAKFGRVHYEVVDKNTGKSWVVLPREFLSQKQAFKLGGRPDMIWQFSQYLGRKYAEEGKTELKIYARAECSLNGGPMTPLIDPEVDLLTVKWNRFGHNEWVVMECECE